MLYPSTGLCLALLANFCTKPQFAFLTIYYDRKIVKIYTCNKCYLYCYRKLFFKQSDNVLYYLDQSCYYYFFLFGGGMGGSVV